MNFTFWSQILVTITIWGQKGEGQAFLASHIILLYLQLQIYMDSMFHAPKWKTSPTLQPQFEEDSFVSSLFSKRIAGRQCRNTSNNHSLSHGFPAQLNWIAEKKLLRSTRLSTHRPCQDGQALPDVCNTCVCLHQNNLSSSREYYKVTHITNINKTETSRLRFTTEK